MLLTADLKTLHITVKSFLITFFTIGILTAVTFADDPIDLRFEKFSSDGLFANVIISQVVQDIRGFLWVGTNHGLIRYDGTRTKLYQYNSDDPNSLSGNRVFYLAIDNHGILWISIRNGGLCSLDTQTEKIIRYYPESDDPNNLDRFGGPLYVDRSNTLWIGTFGAGFKQYIRATKKFVRYIPEDNNPHKNPRIS